MEAIGTNSINSITQHAAAQNSYGLSTSGGLNVKTEEGDLVSISFSNEFNYSESSSSINPQGLSVPVAAHTLRQSCPRGSFSCFAVFDS